MILDLRTVEGAFAGELDPFHRAGLERFAQRILGTVPGVVRAQALLRTQRELDGDVGETEVLVDVERETVEGSAL